MHGVFTVTGRHRFIFRRSVEHQSMAVCRASVCVGDRCAAGVRVLSGDTKLPAGAWRGEAGSSLHPPLPG